MYPWLCYGSIYNIKRSYQWEWMAIGQYSWCAASRPSDPQESSPWGGFPGRSEGESPQGPVEVFLLIWSEKEEKRTALLWRKGRSDAILRWAITPGLGTSSWSGLQSHAAMWPVGPCRFMVQRIFGGAKSMFVTNRLFCQLVWLEQGGLKWPEAYCLTKLILFSIHFLFLFSNCK
jgi:hypothetical protein